MKNWLFRRKIAFFCCFSPSSFYHTFFSSNLLQAAAGPAMTPDILTFSLSQCQKEKTPNRCKRLMMNEVLDWVSAKLTVCRPPLPPCSPDNCWALLINSTMCLEQMGGNILLYHNVTDSWRSQRGKLEMAATKSGLTFLNANVNASHRGLFGLWWFWLNYFTFFFYHRHVLFRSSLLLLPDMFRRTSFTALRVSHDGGATRL